MNRRSRTALFAASVFALGGLGLSESFRAIARGDDQPARQNQPSAGTSAQPGGSTSSTPAAGDSNSSGAAGSGAAGARESTPRTPDGASSSRDAANEVRGVQDLFAQATDAALMKGAANQLSSLFATENASGGLNPGQSNPSGQRTQDRDNSRDNSGASGTSAGNPPSSGSPTERIPGTNGTSQIPNPSNPGAAQDNSPSNDNASKTTNPPGGTNGTNQTSNTPKASDSAKSEPAAVKIPAPRPAMKAIMATIRPFSTNFKKPGRTSIILISASAITPWSSPTSRIMPS